MKRFRKRLSLLLAAILITASLGQTATVLADVNPAEKNVSVEKTDEDGKTVTETDKVQSDGKRQMTEDEVTESEEAEETEKTETEGDATETDSDAYKPMPMSLRPLTKKEVTLNLLSYSEADLESMTVETILSLLRDENGEPVDVPQDKKVVWAYFEDENGNTLHDELHEIGRGETVNWPDANEHSNKSFKMELIIGNDDQLSAENIRYIVTVYLSVYGTMYISPIFLNESKEEITITGSTNGISEALSEDSIPITAYRYYIDPEDKTDDYYLKLPLDNPSYFKGARLQVYYMKDYLEYKRGTVDELDSEKELSDALQGEGIHVPYGTPEEAGDVITSDNLLCLVYTDSNGTVLACHGLLFNICSAEEEDAGEILAYENNQMKKVEVEREFDSYSSDLKVSISPKVKEITTLNAIRNRRYYYIGGDTLSKDGYYYTLNRDEHVVKIVAGAYNTMDEAEAKGAKDITDQIFAGEGSQAPYGCPLKNVLSYTTLYDNGLVETTSVRIATNYENEWIFANLYRQDTNEFIRPMHYITSYSMALEEQKIPLTVATYYISSADVGDKYSLKLRSNLEVSSSRHDVTVDFYRMRDFVDAYDGTAASLNSVPTVTNSVKNTGLEETFSYPEPVTPDTDNLFCVVYQDNDTGKIVAYSGLLFVVLPEEKFVKGNFYSYENGQMKNVTNDFEVGDVVSEVGHYENAAQFEWTINFASQTNGIAGGTTDETDERTYETDYYLTDGYFLNRDYYFALEANDHIEKIVNGIFPTPEAAEEAGAEDITAQLLPADRETQPYGRKFQTVELEESNTFTVFMDDGTSTKYSVVIFEGNNSDNIKYNENPLVNEIDPWFRVTGAAGYEGKTFVVENNETRTLDTLYGYGYQTVFINDPDADLSNIKPIFEKYRNGDIDTQVRVTQGGQGQELQTSGVSEQDFENGPIQYTVNVGNNPARNYQVTFVKKVTGEPKLYVNYPSAEIGAEENEREIFLTEYFEKRHDILIANIGDQELKGLKVELSDAKNVKLDDYWTIKEDGVRTLEPFGNVEDNDDYAALSNMAKIRLVPDGEGEISGTLTITADGQEPVVIKLTGYANDPRIVTETIDKAVKFVPYSNIIATNNMYDWNKVTFSLADGILPRGVQLYEKSGEIYGVPQESGEFMITVKAEYSGYQFSPSYADFMLTVEENENAAVYNSSDENYSLQEHIGTDAGGYDFVLSEISDQLFVSEGVIDEFVDVYLNGEKLIDGTDYTKESGSTRITVKSQTFINKANRDGSRNTIAAEFRKNTPGSGNGSNSQGSGAQNVNDMKRTAQNFRMNKNATSGGSGGSSSGGSGGSSASSLDNVKADDSWTEDALGWRHQMEDGSWASSTWLQLTYNGQTGWYYFNEQGYMATGWLSIGGNLYYLNPTADGTLGMMLTGWQFVDDKWYYFSEEDDGPRGALVAAGWHELVYNNVLDWYHFNTEGFMDSGWIEDDRLKYYLNPISDGWKGRMLTGWQLIDGKWYYFNEVSDGTKGALLTNAWVGDYYVGSDGAWVE